MRLRSAISVVVGEHIVNATTIMQFIKLEIAPVPCGCNDTCGFLLTHLCTMLCVYDIYTVVLKIMRACGNT